jgi:hypothetical protein
MLVFDPLDAGASQCTIFWIVESDSFNGTREVIHRNKYTVRLIECRLHFGYRIRPLLVWLEAGYWIVIYRISDFYLVSLNM